MKYQKLHYWNETSNLGEGGGGGGVVLWVWGSQRMLAHFLMLVGLSYVTTIVTYQVVRITIKHAPQRLKG